MKKIREDRQAEDASGGNGVYDGPPLDGYAGHVLSYSNGAVKEIGLYFILKGAVAK